MLKYLLKRLDFSCSWVFSIDGHATLAELDEDETIIQESISRLSKRGSGGFEFSLLHHCKERFVRRGNLIHPLRHSEERLRRRENLILLTFFEEENRKR